MLNVKKIFVLSLTASFLYEGSAAMANQGQDFNNHRLGRRAVNQVNAQPLVSGALALKRGGQSIKSDSQPMITGAQPLSLRRGSQPLTLMSGAQPLTLGRGVQTKPTRQTVAQPMITGAQPLTLGRGVQTPTAKPSQPMMTAPQPLALGRGGRAPAMEQEIIINAADVNPNIRRMLEVQGKRMDVQLRVTRQELIEELAELQDAENQGRYPRGTTATLKQELNRILRIKNYNTI